jgi:hypothetical protein
MLQLIETLPEEAAWPPLFLHYNSLSALDDVDRWALRQALRRVRRDEGDQLQDARDFFVGVPEAPLGTECGG